MSYYIRLEDLAANAFIALLKQSNKDRFISYKQLEEYGSEVLSILHNKSIEAILLLSRELTLNMYMEYSDYFEEMKKGDSLGLQLKDDVNIDQLINKFRGYLAWDVLLAFMDDRSLSKLNCHDY